MHNGATASAQGAAYAVADMYNERGARRNAN